MRIYTRAEWNARPPTKVMKHYPKKGIMIHHTASGHNAPQSEAKDLQYQYDCQGWHMRDHNASDILQGVTIFPSGRIVEGRMPWDSDNGAIYNWGGGAVDYVGIENDGTFNGDRYMGDTQYESLVWLCAENVRRGIVPVNFEIKGHRQVYPCRPGDPKPTGCPGNLLDQFVTNGKLERDVRKELEGKEEDMIFGYVVDFKEVAPNDGYKHVYVAAEGWYDLGWVKGICTLLIKNESDEIAVIDVFTTPFSDGKKVSAPPRNDEQSRTAVNMAEFAPKSGFATTLKTNTEITPQLSIIAEKV